VAEEASRYANGLYVDTEAAYGSVDREAVECIEAAAAWHQHALYVLRVLRIDHDQLKPETRVAFSLEIAKAAQRRSDLVKLLKLSQHGHTVDPFSSLIIPAAPVAAEEYHGTSDANPTSTTIEAPDPSPANARQAPVVDRAAALAGVGEQGEPGELSTKVDATDCN
jgi:hypothetical protein